MFRFDTMSETLLEQIKEQGELVRKLKAAKESPTKVSEMLSVEDNLVFHFCYCCCRNL